MLTSTLGGLIKDFRIKKRLSQLEVSLRIGWKDTTRLSKIEQGRVGTPTRETIDKVVSALELNNQEKGEFLLAGGYLPTEEEILNIRKKTDKLLKEWPYPANILDFSWRVISQNEATNKVYQVDSKMEKKIIKEHLRVLEIVFHPDLMQNKILEGKDLEEWHKFLTSIVIQFQYEQRNRTKERWFIANMKEMLKNDLFRSIWREAEVASYPDLVVGKFALKYVANPDNPKKMLNFYLYVVPVLEDLRFEMEMLVPMDSETYQYFHK